MTTIHNGPTKMCPFEDLAHLIALSSQLPLISGLLNEGGQLYRKMENGKLITLLDMYLRV